MKFFLGGRIKFPSTEFYNGEFMFSPNIRSITFIHCNKHNRELWAVSLCRFPFPINRGYLQKKQH